MVKSTLAVLEARHRLALSEGQKENKTKDKENNDRKSLANGYM